MNIYLLLCFIIEIINILSDPLILGFSTKKHNDNNVMKALRNSDIYLFLYIAQINKKLKWILNAKKVQPFLLSESCQKKERKKI